MRQKVATFSNFICHFGNEKALLDYAAEIVLPAFLDDSLVRSYGSTDFFFFEVELLCLNDEVQDPKLAIIGRFVKNTQLSREQIFHPQDGIIRDEDAIDSAPSAFFVLILNNHRLIYLPETSHAPNLSAFRATILKFMNRKRTKYIDELYREQRQIGRRITKKSLYEIHKKPSLDIVPISSDEQIENFVNRYRHLRKIEFKLINPNEELDGEEIFRDIREYLDGLKPESAKIETKSAEGLNIEEAVPRIKAATATTNQEVRLSGTDRQGNKLVGDNNQFQISTPIESFPATKAGLAKKLYGIFSEMVSSGSIRVGEQTNDVSEKISDLLGWLKDD